MGDRCGENGSEGTAERSSCRVWSVRVGARLARAAYRRLHALSHDGQGVNELVLHATYKLLRIAELSIDGRSAAYD